MKKVIIGLVGETGSGKDTVANYLHQKYDAKLMRFADPIKETLAIYFEKASKQDQQWLAMEFKKRFGKDILAKALRKKIDESEGVVVVNGIRFWEDNDFVKELGGHVMYVTADQKLRWQRTANRGEKSDDDVTLEKFQEIEQAETEVLIPEVGQKADFIIRNKKDLQYLLTETDAAMAKIMQ